MLVPDTTPEQPETPAPKPTRKRRAEKPTDTTPRLPPKRTSELTAHEAFDRLCDLRAGRDERRRFALEALEKSERDAEDAITARVPADARPRLGVMLAAYLEQQTSAAAPASSGERAAE